MFGKRLCTCECTYLVFAGWVEGVDDSSSGDPPEEQFRSVKSGMKMWSQVLKLTRG